MNGTLLILLLIVLSFFLQMPRVARLRTLIAKACGVLFSVAGGTVYEFTVLSYYVVL